MYYIWQAVLVKRPRIYSRSPVEKWQVTRLKTAGHLWKINRSPVEKWQVWRRCLRRQVQFFHGRSSFPFLVIPFWVLTFIAIYQVFGNTLYYFRKPLPILVSLPIFWFNFISQ